LAETAESAEKADFWGRCIIISGQPLSLVKPLERKKLMLQAVKGGRTNLAELFSSSSSTVRSTLHCSLRVTHIAKWTLLSFLGLGLSNVANARNTGYVFVSHERINAIAVIDPKQEDGVLKWISTCHAPREMKFRNDRTQMLVACRDDDVIDVIDVATLQVVDHIPTGRQPVIFELARDENWLFVPDPEASTVDEISLEDKLIERAIPVGADPEAILASADGKTLFVASEANDLVHIIDLSIGAVMDNIQIGTRPRCFLLLPNNDELWVSNGWSAEVSIIDLVTKQVSASVGLRPPGNPQDYVTPVGMTVTKDGATVVAALGQANALAFVDTATRTVRAYVPVGSDPRAVALSPDQQTLYVANAQSDDVSVVDMVSHKAIGAIPVGRLPHSILVDN
jgi:YVTN family beta-propeller protein